MGYDTTVTAEELTAVLDNPNLVIFDCRFNLSDTEAGRKAYREGHLPGSHYAHLDEDLSGEIMPGITGRHPLPEKEQFAKKLRSWGLNNGDQVIIYDQSHGGIAARLWWMLQWLGHQEAAVLEGGWQRWMELQLPISQVIPAPSDGDFAIRSSEWQVVSASELEEKIANQVTRLVDARAAARYQGKDEPIDPVAGHIEGAISRPFLENLSEQGIFKSEKQLSSEWDQLLSDQNISEIICYCGSGVTACHNLLAMHKAGHPPGILYPGSWSEWIHDPKRPMVIN